MELNGSNSFIFSTIIWICLACVVNCTRRDDPGIISVKTDKYKIGDDIHLTCTMNEARFEGKDSSCLFFEIDGRNRSTKEDMMILNKTTIMYTVRNVQSSKTQYKCKCGDLAIGYKTIYVGTEPKPVTGFHCRGYDFEYFLCQFRTPENPVRVDYNMKVYALSHSYYYDLKHTWKPENPEILYYNLTMSEITYHPDYETVNFTLNEKNSLGERTQYFSVNTFKNTIPPKLNVVFRNQTSNSVGLVWKMFRQSQYDCYTNGLVYEIRIRAEGFDWQTIVPHCVLHPDNMTVMTEIADLEYSFWRYHVEVRAKTGIAKNSSDMWSEPFIGSFETLPRKPANPPKTDNGSFFIDPTNTKLILYWESLPEYRQNGPNFTYEIRALRDGIDLIPPPKQQSLISATFSWHANSEYEFFMKSQNALGQSENTSVIRVTRRQPNADSFKPPNIYKVFHNHSYDLSWGMPQNTTDLESYTIFWCNSKMESQNQCNSTINFIHVDKNTTEYTHGPQKHSRNFAISANYKNHYSSGMVWAMCTASKTDDLIKLEPELTTMSSNSIRVQWSVGCLQVSILQAYNLSYCAVHDSSDIECIEPEQTITISRESKEIYLKDLKPYTTYRVIMVMYSKEKRGANSDPITAQTAEGVPTPPRFLTFKNITSNAVELSWYPPEHANGVLRSYTISYGHERYEMKAIENDTMKPIYFTLGNLRSFTDYIVNVTAKTIENSEASYNVQFKTAIGVPSVPRNGRNEQTRDPTEIILQWDEPEIPAGEVDFYEILSKTTRNGKERNITSYVRGNNCQLRVKCLDGIFTYEVKVRAVNVAKNDTIQAKKRRHTHPEISSTIGGNYQSIHLRHSRQEREEQRENTMQATTITAKSFDEYDMDDISFKCMEHDEGWQDECRRGQCKLFYSEYQPLPLSGCSSPSTLSANSVIAVTVLFGTLTLMVVFYFGCQKIRKMKNIAVEFPPGLTDLDQDTNKGNDIIGKVDLTQSNESLYHKENHRLLASVCNDSGYLNGVECSLDKSSDGYDINADQARDDDIITDNSDSVEMNDLSDAYSYTSSQSSDETAMKNSANMPELSTGCVVGGGGGYIKPQMLSGYILPQAFEKRPEPAIQLPPPVNSNGYTTLDAMGKQPFTQATINETNKITGTNVNNLASLTTLSNKEVIPNVAMSTNMSENNICGYVTHKQLSDFGQRLQ